MRPWGSGGVAIGDLDGDGQPEVCTAGVDYAVMCVDGSDGSLVWAAAAAMPPVPRPDSFENTPRATPFRIAWATV